MRRVAARLPGPLASLRGRLALGLVLLLAVVVAGSGLVIQSALQSFLLNRLDQQLGALVQQSARDKDNDRTVSVPDDAVILVIGSGGQVLSSRGNADAPVVGDLAAAVMGRPPGGPPRTVLLAGHAYRVLALPGYHHDGPVLAAAALPLAPVEQTLHRLLLVECGVGAAAMVVAGFGGYWVVRLGLRPLSRIAGRARRIATSDLTGAGNAQALRVPDDADGAEIAELATALNAMLAHIDAALSARAEAERRLRQFVADASHELRTPLAAIRGYAELFRRGACVDADDLATAMRRIEEESRRMGVLVDDLLLLTRLDRGRAPVRGPVDLTRLIDDAAADFRAAAPDHSLRVAHSGAPTVVTGDENQLRQVLANLLANVAVHTPPGTRASLTLAVEEGRAIVTVADTGPGIPPHALPHVFERFYRADPSRTRANGGTGLGLAIVRAVVTAHGGTVEAGNGVPGGVSPGTSAGAARGAGASGDGPGGAVIRVTLPLARGVSATSPGGADGTDGDGRQSDIFSSQRWHARPS